MNQPCADMNNQKNDKPSTKRIVWGFILTPFLMVFPMSFFAPYVLVFLIFVLPISYGLLCVPGIPMVLIARYFDWLHFYHTLIAGLLLVLGYWALLWLEPELKIFPIWFFGICCPIATTIFYFIALHSFEKSDEHSNTCLY